MIAAVNSKIGLLQALSYPLVQCHIIVAQYIKNFPVKLSKLPGLKIH